MKLQLFFFFIFVKEGTLGDTCDELIKIFVISGSNLFLYCLCVNDEKVKSNFMVYSAN